MDSDSQDDSDSDEELPC